MENNGAEGSVGAHFERIIFGDETMVAEDIKDAKFSKLTLAIAVDSGWYEADLSLGELFFWGKAEGCQFFENNCSNIQSDELCPIGNQQSCSDNFMYKTACNKSIFSDNCFLNMNKIKCIQNYKGSFYETYGLDSMCHRITVFL